MDKLKEQDKLDKLPAKKSKKDKKPKKVLSSLVRHFLQSNALYLYKNTKSDDFKHVTKVFSKMKQFRPLLGPWHLEQIYKTFFNGESPCDFSKCEGYEANEKETFDLKEDQIKNCSESAVVQCYFNGLCLMWFVKVGNLDAAAKMAQTLFDAGQNINKRYMDSLTAFTVFYFVRISELKDNLKSMRPFLFDYYRKTCIKNNEVGQATAINLILRNYIHYNNYYQAGQFMDQSSFPQNVSNAENVRYLYYTALVKTVKSEYQDAFARVMQSIRKAPECAVEFKQTAQKLAIVVELLMGQIPNKNIFQAKIYQKALFPYFKLCKCVFQGNLKEFQNNMSKFKANYEQDQLYIMINRLTSNVINVGLKRINSSYSKIHYTDVARKLNLSDAKGVEFILAKAIGDGVINATCNHQGQYLTIHEEKDSYSTNKPTQEFEKRLNYCIHLHNQTQRALQYPEQDKKNPYSKDDDDENESTLDSLLKLLEDSMF